MAKERINNLDSQESKEQIRNTITTVKGIIQTNLDAEKNKGK